MTRTRSDSLAAGGLNWDSLPLKLFAGGNAKFWNPADIDFSRDRADWEALSELERDWATRLCAQFIAGEEAVTQDIQPFMAAMRAEGRLGDEMYLTQFAFEEAKHTQVFRHVARRRRDDRRPARLPRRPSRLPEDLLRGAAGITRRPVDRSLAGRPGPRVGDVQPRHRRHDGADGILCVAPDLRGPRHSSRHAGTGPAHR